MTNQHVVENCSAISVTPTDGAAVIASLLASDPVNDLALLRIPGPSPTAAVFLETSARAPGTPVTVVGYPRLGRSTIVPIRTIGPVMAAAAPNGLAGRFRIRAEVRRGNSGGPVLDNHGLVIGVVSAKINTPRVYRRTGRIVRDVGLAIESEIVLDFLARNAIAFHSASPTTALPNQEIFALARRFVARIGCWCR